MFHRTPSDKEEQATAAAMRGFSEALVKHDAAGVIASMPPDVFKRAIIAAAKVYNATLAAREMVDSEGGWDE